ncbi:hypothetical protein [Streptomyces sp. NPDC047028]|uniref:hypothetical protein n=1 Tax=Streptomyces sp. NPDC047028 TaxID=3155793 RepID=UPI0033DFD917
MTDVDKAKHRELLLALETLVKDDSAAAAPTGKWSELMDKVIGDAGVGSLDADCFAPPMDDDADLNDMPADNMHTLAAEIDSQFTADGDDFKRYNGLLAVIGVKAKSVQQAEGWGPALWQAKSEIDDSVRYLHAPQGEDDPEFEDGKPLADDLRWAEVPPTPEYLDQPDEAGLSLEDAARAAGAVRLGSGFPNWWYKVDSGQHVFAQAGTAEAFSHATWTAKDPRTAPSAAGPSIEEAARNAGAARLGSDFPDWWYKQEGGKFVYAQASTAESLRSAVWSATDPRTPEPEETPEQYLSRAVSYVARELNLTEDSALRQAVAQEIVRQTEHV